MALNKDALGAVGEPFELVVERGKIGELALAVGSSDLTRPVPTFFTTMFHWERLRAGSNPWHKVGMSEERGMHAEQEYVFHGPPPTAGTRLVCTSRIESITEKQGKRGGTLTFAVMVTEMRDETGALRVEARMTGVETSEASTGSGSEASRSTSTPTPTPTSTIAAPGILGPITRTDVVRYQGASGDLNPVHHDELFATGAGFPAPLVVGMYPAGAMFAWASDALGADHVRRVRCRWQAPVFPGDVLTISGTVVKEYEEGGEARVDLELVSTKQDGAVAVRGWATFVRSAS